MERSTKYFIWDDRSCEGRSRDVVLWWRADGAGYTTHLNEAGEFSLEEATRITRNRKTDKAVPCEIALDCSVIIVEVDRLRGKEIPNDSQ
jgi:hypothetical protein